MPTDAELTFADHTGRFYARRYGFPPMVGRLSATWRSATRRSRASPSSPRRCSPAAARSPARSRTWRRSTSFRAHARPASAWTGCGSIMSSPQSTGLDITEYQELGELAREGLEVVGDAPHRAAGGAAGDGGVRRLPGGADAACCSRNGMRGARSWSPRARYPSDPSTGGGDERRGAPAIEAAGLRKSFGETVVLDGVDLTVAEGTVFALLGPNGAGKTTIVRILSTLIPADAGEVARRRPRRGRDPDGVRRGDRRHRPVLGARRPAHRRGEPAADGRPEPPGSRGRAAGAWPSCSTRSTSPTRRASRCRPTPAGCAAGWTWR